MKAHQCPGCGYRDMQRREDHAETIRHGNSSVTVTGLAGWFCPECDEAILDEESSHRYGQAGDELLRQQAGKRSQLGVLEQLQESHEGFGGGARAALKGSQSVLGSLADKIRVPDQYVVAIENALGHHLQLVLTEQPESAQQILTELTASKAGRRIFSGTVIWWRLSLRALMTSVRLMRFISGHTRRGEGE